ncbi:MAG: hypothetical protein J6S58_05165 [Lentisphaeria bacterium]|nr:hypothetical protein [Lentisphaeria bacterium]
MLFAACLSLCSCRETDSAGKKRILYISPGSRITTLDPALAADTESQYMVTAFYDTPLQYSYKKRPYALECSMLEKMPSLSKDGRVYCFTLRDDLYFQNAKCFPDRKSRKVKSSDVILSILRLADPRVRSTGYWLIRGKIKGLDKFRLLAEKAPKGDLKVYDKGCEGLRILSDRSFEIHLTKRDPNFLYCLAMPYFAVVSRKAIEYYGMDSFADHPHGSGPFILQEWSKDYVIRAKAYREFREEYYKDAEDPADRKRRLPLLDGIVCYLVKQPLASWLMFLRGELDYSALDGENLQALTDKNGELAPALRSRKIRLGRNPQFQINYIGFHFADPLLGRNLFLRQAISCAVDKELRRELTNGKLLPVYGPLPPGIDGYEASYRGNFGVRNLEKARSLMRKAGYPEGIDPATGKNLVLEFDQAGSGTFHRQNAELLANDLKQIGITLKASFHNRARFFQKLASGQSSLFRLSWTGDYPDAENFLQLFYGPNSSSCNRVEFRDRKFDLLYEKLRFMVPSPERTALCRSMVRYLTEQCPWVFESQAVSYMVIHDWVTNCLAHDFGFHRWKYLSVNPEKRFSGKEKFTPLRLNELSY